jgi:hypothetical protein
MRVKVTPAFIADPPIPAKGITYFWDDSFGLMVTAAGHKSFVVQYRVGKRSRRMTLKKGLTLTEARREAKRSSVTSPRAAIRWARSARLRQRRRKRSRLSAKTSSTGKETSSALPANGGAT